MQLALISDKFLLLRHLAYFCHVLSGTNKRSDISLITRLLTAEGNAGVTYMTSKYQRVGVGVVPVLSSGVVSPRDWLQISLASVPWVYQCSYPIHKART